MTAPLEHLARYYGKKGFKDVAKGLHELAALGRQQGMPVAFEYPNSPVREISKEEVRKRAESIKHQLEELGISARTSNIICKEVNKTENGLDITHVSDLVGIPDETLTNFGGFGSKSLDEIRQHFPSIGAQIFPATDPS